MKSHTISVTVDSNSISVDPDELTMSSQDEVQWASTNSRKFSIVFGGSSPFGQNQLAHEAATTMQQPAIRGRFKYSVVSAENPAVVLDPVIIVEEPPSESKP